MISLNDLAAPMNPLIIGLLRSPLHSLASKGLMVVTWSGRKSGARYAIPVGYQRHADEVIVLLSKPSEKSWWKNFRTPWPAELLIQRRSQAAMGRWLEPGGDEFFGRLETTLQRLPWLAGQFGGIRYDRKIGLTDDQRSVLRQKAGVIRFELTP
jgi:hypothetical protein